MAIVEFCGFPGSGKSTVGRLLIDRLRSCGGSVIDRPVADESLHARYVGSTPVGTVAEALKYGIERPSWARPLWAIVRRSRSRRTVRSMIRIQNQLRTALALGGSNQLVLDEWFVHEAWLATIDSQRVTPQQVQEVLRAVSVGLSRIPRLLVRLDAPPSIAAARVLSREQITSFDRFSQDELEGILGDAYRSLDVLCRTAAENAPLLTFDTSVLTPCEVVEQLVPHVRAL